MCGIVGYFGSEDVDLKPSAAALLHRGPDMQGITSGSGWKIAFNRLSIIDVSDRGMQPFAFTGVSVVMNGEIYNYRELKEEHKSEFTCHSGSDVEIVPFLYKKYGIQFLRRLNGMFAMAIMDPGAGKYLLVRDRYGKKPLFYRRSAGGLYFASELKALKRLITLHPDKTNLALNMACWLLIQPLTPYQDVFCVRPGHYLEFDGTEAIEHQWYQPQIKGSTDLGYEQIRDNFISLYRKSIALRLRSDVPVGISLSGGLDSSSMAYLAREMSPDNFLAFTANIVGKERWEGSTDTENPHRLCNDLKIQQISTVVDFDYWNRNIVDIARNYDEIFLNSGTLIFYAISAAAQANGVKVLLSGVGGDELFGGYPWQARIRSLAPLRLRSAMLRPTASGSALASLWSKIGPGSARNRIARGIRFYTQFRVWHAQSLSDAFVPYMGDVYRRLSERIESVAGGYFRTAVEAVPDDPYNEVQYANIFTVIGNQNYQLDMASMRHSVENRSPLLDVDVVEYLMSVPDRLKNEHGPKSLMRGMLAEFLPQYITKSKKSGPTMPLDQWFSNAQIGATSRSFLLKNRELIGDILSPNLADHLQDEELYRGPTGALRLFALLSFVIWGKVNIESSVGAYMPSFTELANG